VDPHEVLNPPANSDVAAARSAALRPLNAYERGRGRPSTGRAPPHLRRTDVAALDGDDLRLDQPEEAIACRRNG
jgi:hypothetical protein